MKIIKIVFFSALFYFGFAEVKSLVYAQIPIRVNQLTSLRFGYSVQVFGMEPDCIDCGENDVNDLIVFKNGKIIFKDSTEWYSGSKADLYPLLLRFGSNRDELLISTRHSGVIRLTIKKNQVVKMDTLPYFSGAVRPPNRDIIFSPINFDNINIDEWLGKHGSVDSNKLIYDPFVFYRLTKQELTIDTSTTESITGNIYGKFYGFSCSDTLSFPALKIISEWSGRKWLFPLAYLNPKALHTILNNEF